MRREIRLQTVLLVVLLIECVVAYWQVWGIRRQIDDLGALMDHNGALIAETGRLLEGITRQ
jgi:regulatory protein YycH of two-component signal transduction system YycFG